MFNVQVLSVSAVRSAAISKIKSFIDKIFITNKMAQFRPYYRRTAGAYVLQCDSKEFDKCLRP